MTQDTRKDKRAKVVSLNVRYKSATVDEFIENHSHDVSKGGIFVKTPTPFPPGTLLKFEIRLAGDKSVISGVGRVVWKREPTSAGVDKPAGMGVKFIKIDDASRNVIDRLIATKADAGSAYTSDPAALEEDKPPAQPTTLRGLAAAADVSVAPPAPAASIPRHDALEPPTATAPFPIQSLPTAAPKPASKSPAVSASATTSPMPNAPGAASGTSATAAPSSGGAAPVSASVAAAPSSGASAASAPGSAGAGSKPAAAPPRAGAGTPAMAKTMPLGGAALPAMAKTAPVAPPRAGGPPAPVANKPATAIGIGLPPPPAVAPPPAPPAPSRPPVSSSPHAPAGAPTPAPAPVAGAGLAASAVVAAAAAGAAGSVAPGPARGGVDPRLGPPAPMRQANPRKATMMGVGLPAPSSAPGAEKVSQIPTPIGELSPSNLAASAGATPSGSSDQVSPGAKMTSPMFPKMESVNDHESVREPTVMKQAAELLEEALREAGGSMEEIGQNPLFTQSSQRGDSLHEAKPPAPLAQSGDTLMMGSVGSSASALGSSPPPAGSRQGTSGLTSTAKSQPPAAAATRSSPPRAATTSARPASLASSLERKKSGSGGLLAGLVVVALLLGGGVYAFQSGALAGVIGSAAPPATNSAPPAPTLSASAPTPSGSDSAGSLNANANADGAAAPAQSAGLPTAAAADASAGARATADAGAAAPSDTPTAATPTVKPTPTAPPAPAPRPRPKPVPAPAPTPTTEPETKPEPTATTAPTAAPAPTPTTTAAPTATTTSTAYTPSTSPTEF